MDYAYKNIKTPEYIMFTGSKNLKNGVKEVFDNTEKALNHYTHFNALSENKDGINLFMEMYSVLKDYKEFIYKSENDYILNIIDTDSEFRERLYDANEKIREHLKLFIFV